MSRSFYYAQTWAGPTVKYVASSRFNAHYLARRADIRYLKKKVLALF